MAKPSLTMLNQAKIIGNGLIARGFSNTHFSKKCLLIAAGVSYSLESNQMAFRREEELLRDVLDKYKEFRAIYFSTCSVYQSVMTPYIEHKLAMEKIVGESADSYLIFRLPQAVGVAQNRTLIPFLVQEMLKRNPLMIQLRAKRNLIDVSDVARIVHQIIETGQLGNGIVNIAAKDSVTVSQIVSEIAEILNCPFNSVAVDAGESYDIPIDYLEQQLPLDDPILHHLYWKRTLSKYVPLIAEPSRPSAG